MLLVNKVQFNKRGKVRINIHKKLLTKNYLPNWSNKVDIVYKIQFTFKVTAIFKIIKGRFFEKN